MDFNNMNVITLPLSSVNYEFYIGDITNIDTIILLLNRKDYSNIQYGEKIKQGVLFGCVIIYSDIYKQNILIYRSNKDKDNYNNTVDLKKNIQKIQSDPSNEIINNINSQQIFKQYIMLLNNSKYNFTKVINTEEFKMKCINLPEYSNDIVIRYYHNMRNKARIKEDIFTLNNSIIPDSYYNYIITDDGIIIGKVIDILENGVIHPLLVKKQNDPVIIAGEIMVKNNNLTFNFMSGIYSSSQKDIFAIYNLNLVLKEIFALHLVSTKPFDSITFKKEILLPQTIFSKEEILSFCSSYPISIVIVPHGYRCKFNVYTMLPPNIITDIEKMMMLPQDKFLLCKNFIGLLDSFGKRLNRQSTLPIEEKPLPTENMIQVIEAALRIFGLNDFKLGTHDEMFKLFEKMTKNIDNYGTFISLDKSGIYKTLQYTRKKMDGTMEYDTFTFVKNLTRGSFNMASLYRNNKGITVIIRRNKNNSPLTNIKLQYVSFYENLKHIILYILIRKYISDIPNKFIPKPFHIGFLKLDEIVNSGNINTIMVMEGGRMDLSEYIDHDSIKIKKMIAKVYYMLYMIYSRLKINFKHNDMKGNNIVITREGEPMLIDFGLSEFTLIEHFGITNKLEFKAYGYEEYEPSPLAMFGIMGKPSDKIIVIKNTMYIISEYNMVHDILQLMLFLFISGNNPYTIFPFTKRQDKYIMDGKMLHKYINAKLEYNIDDNIFFRYFYNEYAPQSGLINGPINLEMDIKKGIISADCIVITPEKFAENIGVNIGELVVGKYNKKYLKYKYKYLALQSKDVKN